MTNADQFQFSQFLFFLLLLSFSALLLFNFRKLHQLSIKPCAHLQMQKHTHKMCVCTFDTNIFNSVIGRCYYNIINSFPRLIMWLNDRWKHFDFRKEKWLNIFNVALVYNLSLRFGITLDSKRPCLISWINSIDAKRTEQRRNFASEKSSTYSRIEWRNIYQTTTMTESVKLSRHEEEEHRDGVAVNSAIGIICLVIGSMCLFFFLFLCY